MLNSSYLNPNACVVLIPKIFIAKKKWKTFLRFHFIYLIIIIYWMLSHASNEVSHSANDHAYITETRTTGQIESFANIEYYWIKNLLCFFFFFFLDKVNCHCSNAIRILENGMKCVEIRFKKKEIDENIESFIGIRLKWRVGGLFVRESEIRPKPS